MYIKMSIKYKIIPIIILLLVSGNIYTQMDTIHLEEILVTARASKDIIQSNISGESIELSGAHDVGEIFLNQSGFGVIKRGNYAMEPVLRGYKYEQLNVQINGGIRSSNACPNRMDPAISQVSPEDIEKVEIIKGPYSVRFGPSFGGILNIITKRPEKSDMFKISGSVDGGFKSNGSNYFGNVNLAMVNKSYDLLIGVGYKDYGNYISGDGDEIASSFTRTAYSVRLGLNPGHHQRIQINWQQGFARDILHAGLPMDADKDDASIFSVDYQNLYLSEKLFSLKAKVYGSFVDHEMSNKNRPNYAAVQAVTPVNAMVYGGRTELGIKASENNFIYLGMDYEHIEKDGIRIREVYYNACSGASFDPPMHFEDLVWQDSKKDNVGLFFENKYQIRSDMIWLSGIRLDYTAYSINNPAPDFEDLYNNELTTDPGFSFSAHSSVTWQINEGTSIQWAIGRGVRTPELLERYINHFSVGMDAFEYVGNPYLEPEINYQTDLKIEKRWNSGMVYGDVFYSYLNNFIAARVDTSIDRKFLPCMDPKNAKRFINVEKAFMYGFEAGLEMQFLTKLSFRLGAGYTYAQNISWDEPLSEIPPFAVNTSLTYKSEKLEAALNTRIVAKQARISESFSETETPGFTVTDFNIYYTPVEMLKLYFSITNIFDVNYVEHLSRAYKNMDVQSLYYERGRSFNIGMKFNY